ncbi:endonuclease/exonuclease/phosphatase family protein [Novosphingobium sp.]|uniref:endonuclease/exonuclease/phosphatase family protein n=1 Tax=Novosphingobium sp. TaxID=1874826 RepID=UPI00286D0995|nr:endonuclease/exonuclease/phosphatase family protein [Novosphingobium sp.]
MQLTFATYNIHKAVGMDRRRNPDRILAVLAEVDADVIALQEVDRRIGLRESVLPLSHIEDYTPYRAVPLNQRPDSMGWHGNALLVRRDITLAEAAVVPLPVLEPRGAIRADLVVGGHRIRVVGMHLDLSGLRRRQQLRAIMAHLGRCGHHCPTVVMGDCNEWGVRRGSLSEFAAPWQVLAPGRSFPARQPVARLDRIALSGEWRVIKAAVHHSALAVQASDHLPVMARLELPKNWAPAQESRA